MLILNKKIVACFIISLLCSFFYSNELNNKDNEFERICNKLSKNVLFRGDFELEQFSAKTQRKIISSGNFTLSSQDGIIWFTTKPINSVMAVTDSFIVQQMKGKRRKIDGSKNKTFSQMANIISALFTGKYDVISKDFTIDFNSEKKNNLTYWKAKLVSNNSTLKSYIKEINISGFESKNSSFISEIELIQFNDDKSTYRLNNQKVIDTLNDDEKQYFEK